jgi:hypothetical protein
MRKGGFQGSAVRSSHRKNGTTLRYYWQPARSRAHCLLYKGLDIMTSEGSADLRCIPRVSVRQASAASCITPGTSTHARGGHPGLTLGPAMGGGMFTRTPSPWRMSSTIPTLRSATVAPVARGHAPVIHAGARGHHTPHPWSSSLTRAPGAPGAPAS